MDHLPDNAEAFPRKHYGRLIRRRFPDAYALAYVRLGSRAEAAALALEAFTLAARFAGPSADIRELESHFDAVLKGILKSPPPLEPVAEPESTEQDRAVRGALLGLDASTRLAVVLRHYAGWKARDIAKACGMEVRDVEARLRAAENDLGAEFLEGIPRAIAPAITAEEVARRVIPGYVPRDPSGARRMRLAAGAAGVALLLSGLWAAATWRAPRSEPAPAPAPMAAPPPRFEPAPAPADTEESPGGVLTGRVIDGATGAPVSEFEVAHPAEADDAGRPVFVAVSDAEGRFHIAGLGSGTDELRIRAEGYAEASVSVDPAIINGSDPALEVRLERLRSVEGLVVDSEGIPVEGALLVTGDLSGPPAEGEEDARSDGRGRFRIAAAPAGKLVIRAYHADHAAARVEVPEGADDPLRLVLSPAGRVRATVRVGGEPLAGAVVTARSLGAESVQGYTDPDGHCLLTGVPTGPVEVFAQSASARFAARRVEVARGRTAEVAFELEPASSRIEGIVFFQGTPVPHARVEARVVTGTGDEYRTGPLSSFDGRYRTDPLPPGDLTLDVMAATSDSRLRRQRVALTLPPGETVRHDVHFSGRGVIRGDLVGLEPDQHARVFALIEEPRRRPRSLEQLNELTHTAVGRRFMRGNGVFRFESLEPGEYTLYALALRDESPEDFAQAPVATARVVVGPDEPAPATLTF